MNDFWTDFEDTEIQRFSLASLSELEIPEEEKEFLSTVGLPDSAAPFLSFEKEETGFNSVAELWKQGPEFQRYKVIGSNGSGDPVSIDAKNGEVVYFNHDNQFAKVLINTSPSRMAKCLVSFRKLVVETQKEKGAEALLDNDIPKHLQNWFKDEVRKIDPKSLTGNTFWSEQIEQMAEGPW